MSHRFAPCSLELDFKWVTLYTGSMTLQFSKATLTDAEAIAKLVNSAYRGEASKVGWTTEADLLGGQRTDTELVTALIEKKNSYLLIARPQASEEIIACTHLQHDDEVLHLGMLAIKPDLQNQGLGRRIILEAENFAKECQCAFLEISVISVRQELIAWYERLGFCKTGQHLPFPSSDPRFGLPKVKDLQFLILRKRL